MSEIVDFVERKYSCEVSEIMRLLKRKDFYLESSLGSALLFAECLAEAPVGDLAYRYAVKIAENEKETP